VIRRLERDPAAPLRRLGVSKRNQRLELVVEDRTAPELALRYSNGFVTVEITHDALDAFVEANGDVPLPVYVDEETGDRRTYDPASRVRVIYDREARLREVTSRGRDGLYVRLTVLPDAPRPNAGGDETFRDVAGEERQDADGDGASDVVDEERVEPQDAGDEDGAGAEEDGQEAQADVAVEAGAEQRPGEIRGDREPQQIAAGGAGKLRYPSYVTLEYR
jgi:hypothetical protein